MHDNLDLPDDSILRLYDLACHRSDNLGGDPEKSAHNYSELEVFPGLLLGHVRR